MPLVEVITDAQSGEIKHERTGETAKPKFPFDHKDVADAKATRRVQLAKQITSTENPYFAKSYANRAWSCLTGVGIIDARGRHPGRQPRLQPGDGLGRPPQFGKNHSGLFELKDLPVYEKGTIFTVTVVMKFGTQHTIGKFRVSATTDTQLRLADGVPENLRAWRSKPGAQRTQAEKAEPARFHCSRDGEYLRLAGTVGSPPPTSG